MAENFYIINLGRTYITPETPESKKIIYVSNVTTETVNEINSILRKNLSEERYKHHMDHLMLYKASPSIKHEKHEVYSYATILFVRTLTPINHPLFMSLEDAYYKLNFCRFYTFDDVYDQAPGMHFNNMFKGTFFNVDSKNNVKFNPVS